MRASVLDDDDKLAKKTRQSHIQVFICICITITIIICLYCFDYRRSYLMYLLRGKGSGRAYLENDDITQKEVKKVLPLSLLVIPGGGSGKGGMDGLVRSGEGEERENRYVHASLCLCICVIMCMSFSIQISLYY